ncbi:translocation/assembly module TamB domain-containing protein [Thalassotalea sp. LPB0316]|uniref:translocation/assembly module TamB domain-containing protein n=1 Tax=Thalassotalea sp. LPB0316 TaxID=2769490 RepID=UPI0018694556|nr:translocation/assembly module TamB domain-containing protein [Thalassotalea sp. LPB0316]QOL25228.1 translocation/assembly module TamB domain-containing protein [Thalassotalea sp. LPB0316]
MLVRLTGWSLGIVVIITILLVVLTTTSVGARLALKLVDSFVPQVELEYQSGQLNDKIALNYLRINHESADLVLKNIMIDWEPIFGGIGQLRIKSLQISHLALIRHSTETANDQSSSSFTLPVEPINPISLPFNLKVDSVKVANASIKDNAFSQQFVNIELSAQWLFSQLNIEKLKLEHPQYGEVALHGSAKLAQFVPLSISAQIKPKHLPGYRQLKGTNWLINVNGDLTALTLAAKESTNIGWQLDGNIKLNSASLPFELTLDAPHMLLPDNTQLPFDYRLLTANVVGDVNKQVFDVSAYLDAKIDEIPYTTHVEVSGSHVDQILELTSFYARQSQQNGTLAGNGRISFAGSIDWQITAELDNLHLPAYKQMSNAIANGQIQSQGYYHSDSLAINFPLVNLSGSYQGEPVKLAGDLSIAHQLAQNQWSGVSEQLNIALSGLNAQLHGKIDQQWQVQGQISIDKLSKWLPEIAGSLDAQLTLEGAYDSPTLTAETIFQNVSLSDIKIPSGQLKAQYQPALAHNHNVELLVPSLLFNEYNINNLSILQTGDLSEHTLTLESSGDVMASLTLNGALDDALNQWRGTLKQTSLQSVIGNWQLTAPMTLAANISEQKLTLGSHCWQAKASKICLPKPATLAKAGQLNMTVLLSTDELAAPFLRKDYTLVGDMQGELDLAWSAQEKPAANLSLSSADMVFTFPNLLEETSDSFQITTFTLNASSDTNKGQFALNLATKRNTQLNADVQLEHSSGKLSGHLDIGNAQLAHFVSMFTEVQQLEGQINGHLTLSGELKKPEVHGKLSLEQGKMLLFANPTPIENLNLQALFSGQQAEMRSAFDVGKGTAAANADINWSMEPEITGQLMGENLLFLLPPESDLELSPNLQFTLKNNQPTLQGVIDVPRANLVIRALPPNTIELSDDQVFIDSKTPTPLKNGSKLAPLKTNIQVNLGNSINFNALGMTGTLAGNIELLKSDNRPTELYGPLNLVSGEYKAYGQRLKIQPNSVINFSGPVDNANLNIRAAREIKLDDVIAGLNVTGTIAQPLIKIYSDPVMEEQEALSYIIRGKGLHADQSNQSVTTATSIGSATLSVLGVTDMVEELTGIRQLEIDTYGEGDDTQVTVSGMVTDHIYLKYGIGVYQPLNEITMRLYLIQQSWLETVSGLNNSIDIYYSFYID